jgi:hypothetical protein
VTTPAPAVATNVTTYAARAPYVTVTEFLNSPTAVQIDNLVLGGTSAAQTEALAVAIERASSWADAYTYQVMAATLDLAYGRARVRSDGTIHFPLPYKPIISVLGISVGSRPSAMTPMGSLVDVVIGQHGTIEFTAYGVLSNGYGNGSTGFGVSSRPLVQVSYVNGYPNTLTTGTTTAGATTLPVASVLGIYPGSVLTIYDGPSTEAVIVAPTYVPGSLTLTLTAPTASPHTPGVSVSALPPKVKQAVILLTAALIDTSGTDAIVLNEMAEPGGLANEKGASAENIALAMDMLDEFKRAW